MTNNARPWLLGGVFIVAGAMHLLHPAPYLAMMPSWLPFSEALVWWSGLVEIAGGLGVLLPPTRALAGWCLIALVIAVFPANLQVALHGWPGYQVPPSILWLRLPLQPLFIWWSYRATLRPRRPAVPNCHSGSFQRLEEPLASSAGPAQK